MKEEIIMIPVNQMQNFRVTFFGGEASRAALLNENVTAIARKLLEHGSRQLKEAKSPTEALIIAGLVVGLVIVICCKMRQDSPERQYAQAIAPPREREMMRV